MLRAVLLGWLVILIVVIVFGGGLAAALWLTNRIGIWPVEVILITLLLMCVKKTIDNWNACDH